MVDTYVVIQVYFCFCTEDRNILSGQLFYFVLLAMKSKKYKSTVFCINNLADG